ncbi:MAG: phenylacetate--CoA ligase, partial [Actinobacteria bacterium]|nr:phenylacetate--CoA ligase [Actinomycetota bacterium]
MGNYRFWDEKISLMQRDKLKDIQVERLRDTLKHCYNNNRFYKNRFDEAGLDPEKISSLSDLEKFPFTSKEELRENYPFGLFCTPLEDIVRIH